MVDIFTYACDTFLLVSDDYFKNNSIYNPTNLLRSDKSCKTPQLRYRLHPNHAEVYSDYKYLAYEQCFPTGCFPKSTKTFNIATDLPNERKQNVSLTNDTLCLAYDGFKVPIANRMQCI